MISRRHFFLSAGAVPALAPAFQGALQSVDIPEIPADALRPAAEVPAPFAGAQWKIKYFHDRADSGLILTDLVAPSPGFVLASGVIEGNRRGKPKDLGIVSRDGGATWNEIKLPRGPATLFALDAGHLWLAATGRLYFSSDQGGKWTRLKLPKRMGRVVFTTPRDGWAYGAGKVFYRTADGGQAMDTVPESQELKLTDEFTVYRTMEFHEGRGGVLVRTPSPQGADGELPAWIAPERAMARRPPATTAMFTTLDGGASWKSAVTAAFGDVVRLRLGARRSVALFEYGEGFLFPTEVFSTARLRRHFAPVPAQGPARHRHGDDGGRRLPAQCHRTLRPPARRRPARPPSDSLLPRRETVVPHTSRLPRPRAPRPARLRRRSALCRPHERDDPPPGALKPPCSRAATGCPSPSPPRWRRPLPRTHSSPPTSPKSPRSSPPASELPASLSGAQWKVSYFHDFADSSLVFSDFISPSPDFALAAGIIDGNRRGKPKEFGLVSRDGGLTWNEIKLPSAPALLFALDASHIWLASPGRLYFSADQGRKWSGRSLPKQMARVCFTSPLNGFSYGRGKTFYRTTDGGRRWSPVAESQKLNLTDEFTFLRTMRFQDGRIGILMATPGLRPDPTNGRLDESRTRPRPPPLVRCRRHASHHRWRRHLETLRHPAIGTVLRMKVQALSATLLDYGEGFVCPSEVYLRDHKTGKNRSLFRRKALRVTDFLFHGAQGYLLSAIEPFGTLPGAGLPGRLRILYSPTATSGSRPRRLSRPGPGCLPRRR